MNYAAAKSGIHGFTKALAQEGARYNITVNAIAPGYTDTPMTAAIADDPTYGDAIKQFVASIPIARAGLPVDMANAVDFLLSDNASFVCGSVLFIDGGHDAMLRPDEF